jgi:hypothetical protein
MTIEQLLTEANEIQAVIENDLRDQGLNPEMGDYFHPLNEAWKCLLDDITEARR